MTDEQKTIEMLQEVSLKASNAMRCIETGEYKEALRITRDIQCHSETFLARFPLCALLIEIGKAMNDEELLREGIAEGEELIAQAAEQDGNYRRISYNIGNGYQYLYDLRVRSDATHGLFNKDNETRLAKKWYQKAVSTPEEELGCVPELLTNIGNCFDSVGRGLDAIEYYDLALDKKSDFGMALAEKGIALKYLAPVLGEHIGTQLLEAYRFIQEGLALGVEPHAEPAFQLHLDQIRQIHPRPELLDEPPEYPGLSIEADSEYERFLIEFSLRNNLYLNPCGQCRKCNAAYGDSAHIKQMLVKLDDVDLQDWINTDPYLNLSRYFNQIKQDYVTARFLLAMSQHDELDINFADKHVALIDTFDYCEHNINLELMKTSFCGFFNIMDKIAAFLNDYLSLRIPDAKTGFFKEKQWYKNGVVREEIIATENYRLNALFDIFLDFKPRGIHRKLKDTRNALTHRFISVRMMQEKEDATNMTIASLRRSALEIAHVARNAVMYLILFVNEEEQKKISATKGPLGTLDAYELVR